MAFPATDLATRTAGEFVDEADWNELVAALNFLGDPPACRVYHNVNQSIAHNSLVAAAFNAERFDTDGMHDTATNNTRITFNTAGVYVVTWTLEMASATDYTRIMAAIILNGGTYLAMNEVGTTTQSDVHRCSVSTVHKFVTGEYVEAQVQHVNGAGAARNLMSTTARTPEFAAAWIGRG